MLNNVEFYKLSNIDNRPREDGAISFGLKENKGRLYVSTGADDYLIGESLDKLNVGDNTLNVDPENNLVKINNNVIFNSQKTQFNIPVSAPEGNFNNKLNVGSNNANYGTGYQITSGINNTVGFRGWKIDSINTTERTITVSNRSNTIGNRDAGDTYDAFIFIKSPAKARYKGINPHTNEVETVDIVITQDCVINRYDIFGHSDMELLSYEGCELVYTAIPCSNCVFSSNKWIGKYVSFVAYKHYDNIGPIESIENINDGYSFTLKFGSNSNFPKPDFDGAPYLESEEEPFNNYIFIPDFPDAGCLELSSCTAAFGYGSKAFAYGSFALGVNNKALGKFSAALGRLNTASYASLVGGRENTVTGRYSFSAGRKNNISSDDSIAVGSTNTLEGDANRSTQIALGYNNKVKGNKGVAIGCDNENRDPYAITIGSGNKNYLTTAGGYDTTTALFGYSNITQNGTAPKTTLIGHGNIADFSNSEGTGRHTLVGVANKILSTNTINTCNAFGLENTFNVTSRSSGNTAGAYGQQNMINHAHSFAYGEALNTTRHRQTVYGMFNNNTQTSSVDGEILFGTGSDANNRSTCAIFNSQKAQFNVPVSVKSLNQDVLLLDNTTGKINTALLPVYDYQEVYS